MSRTILIILIAAIIGTAGGLTIYAAWPKNHPAQNCQFLRWEYQQLWPNGGGPPLPAGCYKDNAMTEHQMRSGGIAWSIKPGNSLSPSTIEHFNAMMSAEHVHPKYAAYLGEAMRREATRGEGAESPSGG